MRDEGRWRISRRRHGPRLPKLARFHRARERRALESGLWPTRDSADRSVMQDPVDVRLLMPLMREFGDLARRRVGVGVTPLEYQRYLDLKSRIGRRFSDKGAIRPHGGNRRAPSSSLTRLVVSYANRDALLSSIVDNINPVGLLVTTPFAAEVGTRFLIKVSLEREGEAAEFPAVVVTSITRGALTLSTSNFGMSLKIEKMNPAQSAGVSKIFDRELDKKLGSVG